MESLPSGKRLEVDSRFPKTESLAWHSLIEPSQESAQIIVLNTVFRHETRIELRLRTSTLQQWAFHSSFLAEYGENFAFTLRFLLIVPGMLRAFGRKELRQQNSVRFRSRTGTRNSRVVSGSRFSHRRAPSRDISLSPISSEVLRNFEFPSPRKSSRADRSRSKEIRIGVVNE